jgi:hypothetical protein
VTEPRGEKRASALITMGGRIKSHFRFLIHCCYFFSCVSNHAGTNPISNDFLFKLVLCFFCFVFGLLYIYLKTICM